MVAGFLYVTNSMEIGNKFLSMHQPQFFEYLILDRGARRIEGILLFEVIIEESNRDHNYIWSSVQCGNYIYIDTCKNPISGIYKKNH